MSSEIIKIFSKKNKTSNYLSLHKEIHTSCKKVSNKLDDVKSDNNSSISIESLNNKDLKARGLKMLKKIKSKYIAFKKDFRSNKLHKFLQILDINEICLDEFCEKFVSKRYYSTQFDGEYTPDFSLFKEKCIFDLLDYAFDFLGCYLKIYNLYVENIDEIFHELMESIFREREIELESDDKDLNYMRNNPIFQLSINILYLLYNNSFESSEDNSEDLGEENIFEIKKILKEKLACTTKEKECIGKKRKNVLKEMGNLIKKNPIKKLEDIERSVYRDFYKYVKNVKNGITIRDIIEKNKTYEEKNLTILQFKKLDFQRYNQDLAHFIFEDNEINDLYEDYKHFPIFQNRYENIRKRYNIQIYEFYRIKFNIIYRTKKI